MGRRMLNIMETLSVKKANTKKEKHELEKSDEQNEDYRVNRFWSFKILNQF